MFCWGSMDQTLWAKQMLSPDRIGRLRPASRAHPPPLDRHHPVGAAAASPKAGVSGDHRRRGPDSWRVESCSDVSWGQGAQISPKLAALRLIWAPSPSLPPSRHEWFLGVHLSLRLFSGDPNRGRPVLGVFVNVFDGFQVETTRLPYLGKGNLKEAA